MNFKLTFLFLFSLLTVFLSAQEIKPITVEETGFSQDRLNRIKPFVQTYIDDNKLGGALTMIARKGKLIHFETYGMQNKKAGTAINSKTIFRIFSMSKPIASVALMMLYEEGKFNLNDDVAKYIPEFKNLKVYENGALVPLKNKMTIEHLLTHTSGLSYGWNPTPVDEMYQKANIWASSSLQNFVTKIGKLPLNFQPGTKWEYGVSTDIVGYLVEVISGMPFDQFLQKRLFGPLKMEDTGFHVPKEKHNRLATVYEINKEGELVESHSLTVDHFYQPSPYASGGGGLVSTASDYMRFAQMLLNGGRLDGVQILGRKTVDLMRINHLSDEVKYRAGKGFGLGFEVVEDIAHAGGMGSNGTYSWSGMANTFFWIDPQEEVISMVWTQFLPFGVSLAGEFKILAYQAIVD